MGRETPYKIGLLGSGSWATALAKLLTGKGYTIHWWIRQPEHIRYLKQHRHHPRYLSAVHFDLRKLIFYESAAELVARTDLILVCLPSAFLKAVLDTLPPSAFRDRYVVSAVKGMVGETHQLLNDFLEDRFGLPQEQYFNITGPCHAEEVAAEKLSYLTVCGKDRAVLERIAPHFSTPYLQTVLSTDVRGTQYAAVLKNIYALGAGMAHGLGYGDNFLAVYIANCALEMSRFNTAVCGTQEEEAAPQLLSSAYLGDLLVTCYSSYSRNRRFGNMIGKGYSVRAAQIEMDMVAEGYEAARSVYLLNREIAAPMPVATALYQVLWEHGHPLECFTSLEKKFF
ncbi:NAD(P)H-dependent glycerol-3-phosphate dehydrogenase [Compostibacter hankyongensis]|uniref:Glycerol-3-phosphate dehydrogenase n=1 Tax=Compostibacter hankyongensis TaxID=1007089 RepID=A0ABP8FDP6_9BACT